MTKVVRVIRSFAARVVIGGRDIVARWWEVRRIEILATVACDCGLSFSEGRCFKKNLNASKPSEHSPTNRCCAGPRTNVICHPNHMLSEKSELCETPMITQYLNIQQKG